MKKTVLFVAGFLTIGSVVAGNYLWNKKNVETEVVAKQALGLPLDEKEKEIAIKLKEKNEPLESKNGTTPDKETTDKNSNTNKGSGKNNNTSAVDQGKNTTDSKTTVEESTDKEDTNLPEKAEEKKSLEQIKSEYLSIFKELEAQETSKIDQLVVEAKAEYISNKMSKADLAVKYQEMAVILEKNADRQFYTIYQQLQIDLDKNGYSINEAQSFKTTYDSTKQARLNRVIQQVKQF